MSKRKHFAHNRASAPVLRRSKMRKTAALRMLARDESDSDDSGNEDDIDDYSDFERFSDDGEVFEGFSDGGEDDVANAISQPKTVPSSEVHRRNAESQEDLGHLERALSLGGSTRFEPDATPTASPTDAPTLPLSRESLVALPGSHQGSRNRGPRGSDGNQSMDEADELHEKSSDDCDGLFDDTRATYGEIKPYRYMSPSDHISLFWHDSVDNLLPLNLMPHTNDDKVRPFSQWKDNMQRDISMLARCVDVEVAIRFLQEAIEKRGAQARQRGRNRAALPKWILKRDVEEALIMASEYEGRREPTPWLR